MNVKLCKCGCGAELKMDKSRRMPKWVLGHHLKGKKMHPNMRDALIKCHKGKPLPFDTVSKISAALKGRKAHPNAIAASIARTKGKHGFGRHARDNPNHHAALHWIIRDNRGVIHECDNLRAWCRANEWRFLPDDRPWSKMPMHRRAASGLSSLGQTNGKSCSWHGWTLVSVVERQEQGAPDLMDRDVRDPATA